LKPLIEKFANYSHNLLKLIQKILKELPITQIAQSELRIAFVLKKNSAGNCSNGIAPESCIKINEKPA